MILQVNYCTGRLKKGIPNQKVNMLAPCFPSNSYDDRSIGSGYGAVYHGSIRWFLVGRGIPGMTQQRGWGEGRTWEDLIVIVLIFLSKLIIEIFSHRFVLVGEIHDFISWLEMKMLKSKNTSRIDRSIYLWLAIRRIAAQDLLEPLTSGGLEQSQVRFESWDGDWYHWWVDPRVFVFW